MGKIHIMLHAIKCTAHPYFRKGNVDCGMFFLFFIFAKIIKDVNQELKESKELKDSHYS